MTDLERIFRTIDALTPDEKQQIIDYIQGQRESNGQALAPRVLDPHAGVIWMSDDFDEELPDSFWLGEE